VDGVRHKGRLKGSEMTKKDSQTRQICNEDGTDNRKWRKLKMLYNGYRDRV